MVYFESFWLNLLIFIDFVPKCPPPPIVLRYLWKAPYWIYFSRYRSGPPRLWWWADWQEKTSRISEWSKQNNIRNNFSWIYLYKLYIFLGLKRSNCCWIKRFCESPWPRCLSYVTKSISVEVVDSKHAATKSKMKCKDTHVVLIISPIQEVIISITPCYIGKLKYNNILARM